MRSAYSPKISRAGGTRPGWSTRAGWCDGGTEASFGIAGRGEEWMSPAEWSGARGVDMEPTDEELIEAVLRGDTAYFEPLVGKYSPRVFATARRYARRESEVEDIAQEVWTKAFSKLETFRGDAPFEHWLMRLAVRTCYDFLRVHKRNREHTFTELSSPERDWLESFAANSDGADERAEAARQLVHRLMDMLSPKARMVLTLLEIERRSVKEISALTGWSVSLVKVRAFRARAEMRRCLSRLRADQWM